MADRIEQELGLDATQVLQGLKQLTAITTSYNASIEKLAASIGDYNKVGGVFDTSIKNGIKPLQQRATATAALAAAQAKLNAASGQAKATPQQVQIKQTATQNIAEQIAASFQKGSQKLSADAQRQFNSISAGIAKTAIDSGKSFSDIQNIANNLGKVYTGPANQIANSLKQLNAVQNKTATTAKQSAAAITISWASVGRIVAGQLIFRGLSLLQNAFKSAVDGAIEFETNLARIRTIAPTIQTLDQARDAVRGLSEEFGKPIDDVALGFYEILSNQIGEAGDSAEVLRQSLTLATAAVSSTADAANALSSVINSYKLEAADAAEISGKLFKAVDVGRFTLDEIANSIGRVTAISAPLGVSFDEVLASLSVLTINGVKADEAMTLLSNAMRALLKPTKGMQAAMREVGIASAEAGIAAFGFQGFLEKLTGTTHGTASEIAQLTQNIRVGRGVLGLTGKAAIQYASALRQIQDATGDTAREAASLVLTTNAQEVTKELTKLRNFLVDDFGRSVLPILREVLQTLTSVFRLGKGSFESNISDITAKRREGRNEQADTGLIASKELLKNQNQVIDAAFSSQLQLVAKLNILYQTDKENAIKAQKQITAAIVQQAEQRLSAIRSIITSLQGQIGDASNKIKTAGQEIKDIGFAEQERRLDLSLKTNNLSVLQKASQQLQRSGELRNQALKATTAQDIDAAKATLQTAQARAQAAQDAGLEAGNRGLVFRAEQQIQSVVQAQITLRQREAALAEQIRQKAQAQLVIEQKRLSDATRIVGEIKKFAAVSNDPKQSFISRDAAKKSAENLGDQLTKVLSTGVDLNIDRVLGITGLRAQVTQQVVDPVTGAATTFGQAMSTSVDVVFNKLTGSIDKFSGIITRLEQASNAKFNFDVGFGDIDRGLIKQRDEIKELAKEIANIPDLARAVDNAFLGVAGNLSNLVNQAGKFSTLAASDVQELANVGQKAREAIGAAPGQREIFRLAELTTDIKQALASAAKGDVGPLTALATQVNTTAQRLRELQSQTSDSAAQRALQAQALEYAKIGQELTDAATKQAELNRRQAQAPALAKALETLPETGAQAELDRLTKVEDVVKARAVEIKIALGSIGDDVPGAVNTTANGFSTIDAAMDRTIAKAAQTQAAVAAAAGAGAGGDVATKALGGVLYRAGGGFTPRGTDTIPAMLSPGEFVMNAASTRRWRSQLTAMNANRQPIFREQGGPVTNNNVGDINVNISGPGTGRINGRTLANELRRELRRGTSQL